ncbi:MAG TPA: hypothetical protein VFI78_03590 [Salinimicrobium sp.]|nr:hypothetical protein [Salinimicrobium sp.]
MSELNFCIQEHKGLKPEKITIGSKNIKGYFKCFSGKSGGYWISIIPSLKVSGYGTTEEEAIHDLSYNMDVFCEDLIALSEDQRHLELRKMGWEQNSIFKKKFSSVYADEGGVLQNFDHPEEVKSTMLKTA